jgi:polyphenol oxidase
MTREEKNPILAADCYVDFSFPSDRGAERPRCRLTLKKAGSMGIAKDVGNRRRVFSAMGIDPDRTAAMTLVHGKRIAFFLEPAEVDGESGDGLITLNRNAIPTVTVADCLPIYLFDAHSGAFGMLHSGWRGTGIVIEALRELGLRYGTGPGDISIVLGPCIGPCCYEVDEGRAAEFASFGTGSVVRRDGRAFLSLKAANLNLLSKAGVTSITDVGDCTCCSGDLGSFRREAVLLGLADGRPPAEIPFTRMAAMAGWF